MTFISCCYRVFVEAKYFPYFLFIQQAMFMSMLLCRLRRLINFFVQIVFPLFLIPDFVNFPLFAFLGSKL